MREEEEVVVVLVVVDRGGGGTYELGEGGRSGSNQSMGESGRTSRFRHNDIRGNRFMKT